MEPPHVGSPAATRWPSSPSTSTSKSQGKFGPIDVDALNSVIREAADKDDYTALARLLRTLSLRTFSAPNQSGQSFFSSKPEFCAELVPLIEKGVRAGKLDEGSAKKAMECFKKSTDILPKLQNVPGAEAVVVHGQQGAQVHMNALALASHHEYYWRALLGALPTPVREGFYHLHENEEEKLSEKGLQVLKNQVYTGSLGSCYHIPSRVLSELLFYAISTDDHELIENCLVAIQKKAEVMNSKEEVLDYLRLLETLRGVKVNRFNCYTKAYQEYPFMDESQLNYRSELCIFKFGAHSVRTPEGLSDLAEFLELCHQSTQEYKSDAVAAAAKKYILHPDTPLKETKDFLAVVSVIEKLPFLDDAAKDDLLMNCIERWLKAQNVYVDRRNKYLSIGLGSIDLLCESGPVHAYLVKYIKGISIACEQDQQVCLLWQVAQSNTSRSPYLHGIETIHANVPLNRELREQLQKMFPDLQCFILLSPTDSFVSFLHECELAAKLPIPVIIQHSLQDVWTLHESYFLDAILKYHATFDFGPCASVQLQPSLTQEQFQTITTKLKSYFKNYDISVDSHKFRCLNLYRKYEGVCKSEEAVDARLDRLQLADDNN